MLFLVVLFIIAGLAALVYLVKIKIALEYVRDDKDDNLVLSFYTMKGIFKYKYEMSLMNAGANGIKFKLVKEQGRKEKNASEKKERLKPTEFVDKIVAFKKFCSENNDLICYIRNFFYERVMLVDFNLKIKEGTGNAFYTGILSGVLWSLSGILTSYLSNSYKHMKKCVSINPCFDSEIFTVDFVCIFHARFVHIIMVLVRIMVRRHKLQKAEK